MLLFKGAIVSSPTYEAVWLDEDETKNLERRGISKAQLYEIIGFIGVKTISNYVNHIAQTPVDEQFSAVTEMTEYQEAIKQTTSVPG